jgi:hypothetical protein
LTAAAALVAADRLASAGDRAVGLPMQHVVLLGDSVFDNAVYVPGGPDVVQQLRARLPEHWRATLNAVDGSVTGSVERQLGRLPPDATHLAVSIGGNDALRHASVLDENARSVAEVLERMTAIREHFDQAYRRMLESVLGRGLPTAVCTIYDARFPDPRRRKLAATALAMFNDRITRAAFARDLPLIDLRLICNEDADFANPIEPSVKGGAKIAAAIAALAVGRGAWDRSEVFTR